jgi:hypothetical protein
MIANDSGLELTTDLGYLEVPTLFELLDQANVFWRDYEGDTGLLRAFRRYRVDFNRIDPNFKEAPSADPASDDHAPTPVCHGQFLHREIVERVRYSHRSDAPAA